MLRMYSEAPEIGLPSSSTTEIAPVGASASETSMSISSFPTASKPDTPTARLRSATGQEIMNLVQGLNERGITVIVVTHEREVARFARRILEFRDGRLMSDEPASEEFPPQPMRPDLVETSSDERISSV